MTTTMKRARVAAALVVALGTVGVAAPAANAAPQAGDGCYPVGYGKKGLKFATEQEQRTPVVTHAVVHPIAPGGGWNRSTEMSYEKQVSASVENYAEGTVGAEGVIARAEVKAGQRLNEAGSRTTRRSITQSFSLQNSTKRQRDYVFFSARTVYRGSYEVFRCNDRTYEVERVRIGSWRSFSVQATGTYACDLEPRTALERAVRKICPR